MQKKIFSLLFSFSMIIGLVFTYFSCKKKVEPVTINFSQTVVTAILRPGQPIGKLSVMYKGSALPATDVRYVLTPNIENNNLIEIKNNAEVYLKTNASLQDLSMFSFQIVAKYNKNYENIEEIKTFNLPVRPAFLEFRMTNSLVKGSAKGTIVGSFSLDGEGLDMAKLNNMSFAMVPVDKRFSIQRNSELVLDQQLKDNNNITLIITAQNSHYLFDSNSSLENRKIVIPVSDFELEFKQNHLSFDLLQTAEFGLKLGQLQIKEDIPSEDNIVYQLIPNTNCTYANSEFIAIDQDGSILLTDKGVKRFKADSIHETCFTVEAKKKNKSVRLTDNIKFYWVDFVSRMYQANLECKEGKNYLKKYYTASEQLGALEVYLGNEKLNSNLIKNIAVIKNEALLSDVLHSLLKVEKSPDFFILQTDLTNPNDILELAMRSKIKLNVSFNTNDFQTFNHILEPLLIEISNSDSKIYNRDPVTSQYIELKVWREGTPTALTGVTLTNKYFEIITPSSTSTNTGGLKFKPTKRILEASQYPFEAEINSNNICVKFQQNIRVAPVMVEVTCDFNRTESDYIPTNERYDILKPNIYLGTVLWKENANTVNFLANSTTTILSVGASSEHVVNVVPVSGSQYSGIVATGSKFAQSFAPNVNSQSYNLKFKVKQSPYYDFDVDCQLENIKKVTMDIQNNTVFHGEEGVLFNVVFKFDNEPLKSVQQISLTKQDTFSPKSALITTTQLTSMNINNQKSSDYLTTDKTGESVFKAIFLNPQNVSAIQQVELTAENDLYSAKAMQNISVKRMEVRLFSSTHSCNTGDVNKICRIYFADNTSNINIGTYQVNLSTSTNQPPWQTARVSNCQGGNNNVSVNGDGTINVSVATNLTTFDISCDFEYQQTDTTNKHRFKEKLNIIVE